MDLAITAVWQAALIALQKPTFYQFSLPFVLGVAAGFQGVWQRFQYDSMRCLRTVPGSAYLISRGAFPCGIFAILYISGQATASPWTVALTCGGGSEAILRAKFFIRTKENEDVYRGFFDALKWYQDRCLEASARTVARGRKAFVEQSIELIASRHFIDLYSRVLQNLQGFDPQLLQHEAGTIRRDLAELKTSYDAEMAALGSPPAAGPDPRQRERDDVDRAYRLQLGYTVLNEVNRSRTSYFTLME